MARKHAELKGLSAYKGFDWIPTNKRGYSRVFLPPSLSAYKGFDWIPTEAGYVELESDTICLSAYKGFDWIPTQSRYPVSVNAPASQCL